MEDPFFTNPVTIVVLKVLHLFSLFALIYQHTRYDEA